MTQQEALKTVLSLAMEAVEEASKGDSGMTEWKNQQLDAIDLVSDTWLIKEKSK